MKKQRRIHIVGSGPRTGTTLLTEAMRTCFKIDVACEHEASIMQSNSSFGEFEVLLTKHPSEISAVQYPLFFDRDLYVMCIIRDPRDMVSSFHGAYPDQYWCSLRYWAVFCKFYSKLKTHKRFIVVKYEEFANNPDKVQEDIQRKLPFLETTYKFSEYHIYSKPSEGSRKALKSVRPIESKGVGSWKLHLPRIKQQVHKHGDYSDSLIEFGYERDKKWLSQLDDVEIVDFKTKTPEFFDKKDIRRRVRKGSVSAFKIVISKFGLDPEKVIKPLKKVINMF